MKKLAAFGIIAMILCTSIALLINISSEKSLPKEGPFLENIETVLSENMPMGDALSEWKMTVSYLSGVRRFDDIYIGSEGSLIKDIKRPTTRTFSTAENYVLSFAERNQIKPYFMLVPTAAAILQQEISSYASEDFYNQRNLINRMYSQFGDKVRTTDIYQTLYDKRGEYIYYHTEDLPTSLGGYYIYTELCSRLGIEQKPLDEFSVSYAAHGFYGSLSNDFFEKYAEPDFISLYEYIGKKQSLIIEHYNSKSISKISEDIFAYGKEYEDKTDMVFGGLSPKMEITVNENTEGTILIFGDETAKSWLPFLISNYKKITYIDLNSCSEEMLSAIIPENYDQVLFAYSTANFSEGIEFEKLEYIK